ncbi:MAG TPA: 3'(2'),5'-bisphosphate nucleotidase CysQ [Gemmatimonadota bacterium]|nr:3'(2'),5'-bisphosphate nucleotidase CysQ [Gemmatimonadota bacterium]
MRPASHDFLTGDLEVAARAALAGGRALYRYYGDERSGPDVTDREAASRRARLDVEEKAPGDPVTAADHASNRAVLDLLSRRRPEDPVLSEESRPPAAGERGGRLWVVDPLDGTKEFIGAIGEFAVMVGLAVDGRAVLGAVYRPDPGLLYLGRAGGGAWRAAVDAREVAGGGGALASLPFGPLAVDERAAGPVRLIHSRSHTPEGLERLEEAFGDRGIEGVPCGSVGVKVGVIAEGRADLYVHPVPYLKEWDTCAPEAVLRGAGGRVTDCLGRPLAYGKDRPGQPEGLLAATPEVWTRALPIVRAMAPSTGDRD